MDGSVEPPIVGLAKIVPILSQLSFEEFRRVVVEGRILHLTPDNEEYSITSEVDSKVRRLSLLQLSKELPLHLIACLIREDPDFWFDHICSGQALLLHVWQVLLAHPPSKSKLNSHSLLVDLCHFSLVRPTLNSRSLPLPALLSLPSPRRTTRST